MRFITALVLLVSYVSAETPINLCGRQLANARAWLCFGDKYVSKKGYSSPHQYILDNLADDSFEDLEWPWTGRLGSLSASWSRYKRDGLADECCLKPCTTDLIMDYC